jgi:hypothetical protein
MIARPDVRSGARESPLTVDPARDRPPAALIATPVLLAYDLDVHYVVYVDNRTRPHQWHRRDARSDQSQGQHEKRRSDQVEALPHTASFLTSIADPTSNLKLRRIKVRSHGLDYGDQFNRSTLLAFLRGGFFGCFRHSQNHLSGKAVFMRPGRCNGPDGVIMAVWSDSILGTKIKPRKLCEAGSPNIIHGGFRINQKTVNALNSAGPRI